LILIELVLFGGQDNSTDISEAKFLSTQAKENKPFYEHKKTCINLGRGLGLRPC